MFLIEIVNFLYVGQTFWKKFNPSQYIVANVGQVHIYMEINYSGIPLSYYSQHMIDI